MTRLGALFGGVALGVALARFVRFPLATGLVAVIGRHLPP
jgi:hypothetical protein